MCYLPTPPPAAITAFECRSEAGEDVIASTGIYTQIACIVAMTMESRLRCSLQTIMLRKTGSSFNADLIMTEVFVGQHTRLVDTPFAPLRLTKRAAPIGKRGGIVLSGRIPAELVMVEWEGGVIVSQGLSGPSAPYAFETTDCFPFSAKLLRAVRGAEEIRHTRYGRREIILLRKLLIRGL